MPIQSFYIRGLFHFIFSMNHHILKFIRLAFLWIHHVPHIMLIHRALQEIVWNRASFVNKNNNNIQFHELWNYKLDEQTKLTKCCVIISFVSHLMSLPTLCTFNDIKLCTGFLFFFSHNLFQFWFDDCCTF